MISKYYPGTYFVPLKFACQHAGLIKTNWLFFMQSLTVMISFHLGHHVLNIQCHQSNDNDKLFMVPELYRITFLNLSVISWYNIQYFFVCVFKRKFYISSQVQFISTQLHAFYFSFNFTVSSSQSDSLWLNCLKPVRIYVLVNTIIWQSVAKNKIDTMAKKLNIGQ